MDDELKDLLERCIAEERGAQTRLYRKFAGKVFATALRYSDGKEAAADIAQESWVKVFKNLGKFTEFNSFEGWVLKHRHHYDVSEALSTPRDFEASKQADFTMGEIQTAMAALPKGYRTVIQLYLVDGFSHKEIAEMLQVDVNTSKSQLSRGRKQLQANLKAMARRATPRPDEKNQG